MEQDHPLQGIRVLELGSRTITPYIGKLFTDAGADCHAYPCAYPGSDLS